jgi:hypothetical protein
MRLPPCAAATRSRAKLQRLRPGRRILLLASPTRATRTLRPERAGYQVGGVEHSTGGPRGDSQRLILTREPPEGIADDRRSVSIPDVTLEHLGRLGRNGRIEPTRARNPYSC